MLSSPVVRERRRISSHIRRAEKTARRRDVRSLTRVQQLVRTLLLDELEAYRRAGRFPKNHDFPWKMPSFVDAEGTRCAMAHLMETGGATDAVRSIAEGRNFAFVRELAQEAWFVEWLSAAGLTVDEAAAIQPSYCDSPSVCICGGGFSAGRDIAPAPGVLEASVTSVDGQPNGNNLTSGTATITAVHGNAFGYKVGDVVPFERYPAQIREDVAPTIGQIALIPIHAKPDAGPDGGAGTLQALTLNAKGIPTQCDYRKDLPGKLPTKDQTIAAMQSSSCQADLVAIDGKWDDQCSNSGCFCDATGGARAENPLSIAILLAVVGTMTARRVMKR